jgi:ABC-type polysaccharide/polyol phosphate export permease
MKPANPLRAAFRLPRICWEHRETLEAFVRRELRARIEGSALGRVWPVLQPAVLFVLYYVIFSQILRIGFSDKLPPHGPEGKAWRTTFYLVTGILPWTALAESLGQGTGVVLENANLIKKIAFPSELLPIYKVVVYHVYFLIGFVILLGLQLLVNGMLPAELLWFPLVLFVQVTFISALTMLLSAANVFLRDVMQLVPMLITFWMFTTPVFYDLDVLYEGAIAQRDGAAHALEVARNAGDQPTVDLAQATLTAALDSLETAQAGMNAMQYNPMAAILGFYRSIFSYGAMPFPAEDLLKWGAISLVLLYFCYAFFLRSKGRFADEV